MSNFDDIFESAPQTDEFDKEAWAAKKKAERDEVYALVPATPPSSCWAAMPPPRRSVRTAASSVTIWMCRQLSATTLPPTPC